MIPGAVFLAWGALVYANAVHAHHIDPAWVLNYFWPPVGEFSVRRFLAAQRLFWHAAFMAAVCATALVGCGSRVHRWIRDRRRTGLLVAAEQAALGVLAGGTAVLGLALTGLVLVPVLAVVLAALVLFDVPAVLRAAREVRAAIVRLDLSAPAAIVAAVTVAGVLAGTLAPETANDALRFHLDVPRRLLLLHRLVPQEEYIYAWFPMLPECLSTLAFWLGGPAAVRILCWANDVLIALVIGSLVASSRSSGKYATAAAASWCVLLGVPILAPMAMTDCFVALLVTLALVAQLVRRDLLLAGVLWGTALGTKYQTGIFLLGALVAQLVSGPRGLVRLGIACALPCLPLAARAWLGTGSPVAPFFVNWWGAGPQEHWLPLADVRQLWLATTSPLLCATALFRLATRVSIWDSLCSPLFVVLVPVALLLGRPASMRMAMLVALVVWSLVAGYSGRYLLPLVPLTLIISAGALQRRFGDLLASGPARLGFLALVTFEAAASLHWAYRAVDPNTIISGRETPEAYVRRNVVPRPLFYDVAVQVKPRLNPAVRYYLAGMDNGFYLGGLPYIETEDLPSPWSRWSAESADTIRLRIKIRQRGLRYLFFHETHRDVVGLAFPAPGRWTGRSRAVYEEFFRRYPVLQMRLRDGPAAISFYEFSSAPDRGHALPASLP